MQFCGFCGTELPAQARFCRNCGNFAVDEGKREDLSLQTWQYIDPQDDDNPTEWVGGIAPLVAGEFGQFPASSAPVVPGTPQIGGVPAVQGTPQPVNGAGVQGTPHVAGNTPPLHELGQQAPSTPPQHIWGQQAPPLHHQHSMPLEQHPPAKKWHWRHRHEHAEHQRAKTSHAHRFHHRRTHHAGIATTSKAATGIAVKWAIVLLVAIVVLASGGIIFVLASSPALSMSGSGSVYTGGILQVHGRGFVPGGTITLTIDNGLPAPLAVSRSMQVASMGEQSGAANLADMLHYEQAHNSNGAIVVGLTGAFDANVVAQSSWPAGRNVLHAKESTASRSADLSFTLLAQAAHLVINPSTLDFGTIPQGSKIAESVLIGNNGGSLLNWSATSGGSPWLSLQSSNGILQPGAAQSALYALVDTSNTAQGTYSGEIVLHSNGGDMRIAVHMRVGPPAVTKQAQLKVNPLNLNFGQLTPGQRVTNTLTIGNQGTLALQWQSSTSTANWLSLSLSSGSVQAGGVPQNIQVIVDTNNSSLQAGSNTASITIHSNGGNVTVPVTLTLLAGNTPTPSPSPSPSPSPTLPPSPTSIPPSPSPTLLPTPSPSPTFSPTPSPTPIPTLSPSPTPTPAIQVTPLNLDPTSSNCSQNSDGTYTCTVTVSETTPGNLNWFAPTGIGGTNASFSPSNGQLTASQTSQQVSILSIPCANYSFTFVDQSNNQATVAWSCTPSSLSSPTPSIG